MKPLLYFSTCLRRRVLAGIAIIYFTVATFNIQMRVATVQETHLSYQSFAESAIRHLRVRSFPDGEVPPCAINLYGLPRSFESLVLPSLVKNVIEPNAKYNCHYYVHYYDQSRERAGRSGSGGDINPDEILLLREQVESTAEKQSVYNPNQNRTTNIVFTKDTEADFWDQYGPLVQRIRKAKGDDGRYTYFPWKDKTYHYPTTLDNIIKMWHSIQESWNLMEHNARQQGFNYSRVAMLRSDVVYATPIDIFERGDGTLDFENKVAVVPAFARFPVSDRLVYGPYEAVKIWAAERFLRMEKWIKHVQRHKPGYGLHSERFVGGALFPAMKQSAGGLEIVEHPTMCFFRVRADESVWITDCEFGGPTASAPSITANLGMNYRAVVENILGRECWGSRIAVNPYRRTLDCKRKQVSRATKTAQQVLRTRTTRIVDSERR